VDSVPSGYPGSMLGEAPVRAVSNGTAGIGWITPDPTRPMHESAFVTRAEPLIWTSSIGASAGAP